MRTLSKVLPLALVTGIIFLVASCHAQVVHDEVVHIPALHYYYVELQVRGKIIIHYRVEVRSGPDVNVYLLDESNFREYETSGTFTTAIKEHRNVKMVDVEVEVEEGTYYFVVENMNPEDVSVYVFIEGEKSLAVIGIILIVVIVAIIVVAAIMIRRRKRSMRAS